MFQQNRIWRRKRGFTGTPVSWPATPTYTTWNPLDTSGTGGVTLSNGNLTVTTPNDANYKSARTVRKNLGTGKFYWEVTINAPGSSGAILLGIRDGADALITTVWTYGTYALWRSNGGYWVGGGPSGGAGATAFSNVNDICMFALDLTNDRMWCGRNGTWNNSGNPAANTNPSFTALPAATAWGIMFHADNASGPEVVTANFGASAFTYSVPSGFTAGVPTS